MKWRASGVIATSAAEIELVAAKQRSTTTDVLGGMYVPNACRRDWWYELTAAGVE